MSMHDDAPWRDQPQTAVEFKRRFAAEEDCSAYWIRTRWGSTLRCTYCISTSAWVESGGTLFEFADCGHQTLLTLGTMLEKTKKPFEVWFRAILEISARRNGISATELQRSMRFGHYQTGWVWLRTHGAAKVRSGSEPLGLFVEMDETPVKRRASPNKKLVPVAAEKSRRVRLAHATNNDEASLKTFARAEIALHTQTVSDVRTAYNGKSLAECSREPHLQSKQERRANDAVQRCRWTVSKLYRWLLVTHGSALRPKYLRACLDELIFRYNRRKTHCVERIAARTIASLVSRPARALAKITENSTPFIAFRSRG